jgi:hypothetical protein
MLKNINTIYVIAFIVVGFMYSASYAWGVFFVSILLAMIPFATTYFFFGLPILIVLYHFIFGDSTFAWLSIIFAPFHYFAFTANVLDAVKGIFDID